MEAAIEDGRFIEHAQVHTNLYGTSFEAVESVRRKGRICILDIDMQGVRSIKGSSMRCFYLFVTPPSTADLEHRLRHRATESEDKIQIRLKNSVEEIAFGMEEGNFDAILVNADVDRAYSELVNYLIHWYPHIKF
jgi:guanylate kinase